MRINGSWAKHTACAVYTQPLLLWLLATRRHWSMEVDLSRPVLDVVVPRDGTPLSLSHMNSVTWADLLTELGLDREV